MEKSSALLLSFLFLASPLLSVSGERELTAAAPARGVLNSKAAVYIVTLNPVDGLDEESLHVETLSSILGSAEAAKKALIYSYKHVVHGFAARLIPEQAAELTKLPGVLSVTLSRTYSLNTGMLNLHGMGDF
ncbi:subtilisin-like protease Glyma18g48580 [Phalaenopsis equestris]|uniref:subtilisin-like protease Glyma18g48580 n=1 Tax=Phalaenopsis equestris TaxID=78828 RepID=UPI0009E63E19|nr:subtilisin-like protease Glyma18g48580 [Phalaenopsis equestris]